MSTIDWVTVFVTLISVIVSISAIWIFKEAQTSKKLLMELLVLSAEAVPRNPQGARAQFWMMRKDGFLRIRESSEIEKAADFDIRLQPYTGAVGRTWGTGGTYVASYADADLPSWGLTDDQLRYLPTSGSVVATPIVDARGRTIGVLSIDSPLPLEESGLGEERRVKMAKILAQSIARILERPDPSSLKMVGKALKTGEENRI